MLREVFNISRQDNTIPETLAFSARVLHEVALPIDLATVLRKSCNNYTKIRFTSLESTPLALGLKVYWIAELGAIVITGRIASAGNEYKSPPRGNRVYGEGKKCLNTTSATPDVVDEIPGGRSYMRIIPEDNFYAATARVVALVEEEGQRIRNLLAGKLNPTSNEKGFQEALTEEALGLLVKDRPILEKEEPMPAPEPAPEDLATLPEPAKPAEPFFYPPKAEDPFAKS
jgi:hypothetical protein